MVNFNDFTWEVFCKEDCPWCEKTFDVLSRNFISFDAYYIEDDPHLLDNLDIEIFPTIYRDGQKIGSYTSLLIYLNANGVRDEAA